MNDPAGPLPAADLEHVLDHTRHVWEDYRGARFLLTGSTGFIGSWLLETLVHAQERLSLDLKVTVLVRDRAAFEERLPHLAHAPSVRAHVGDVRVADPPTKAFSHIVHCASASPPQMNADRPEEVEDVILRGSERMIEEAETGKGVRMLQVSSGSVYGTQPSSLERLGEDYTGEADPNDPAQRFGVAKLRAERRGEASVARGVGFVSARAFALMGPRLPLNGQFAIGNFFEDALNGRPIALTGDGSPVRSWLHAADLTAWCWTILARGTPGRAYNVGSEEALTLWDAAHRIAALCEPALPVTRAVEPSSGAPSRYVPSIARARDELGLDVWIPFDDAIRRTWHWLRTHPA